jgi:hypothetical protein
MRHLGQVWGTFRTLLLARSVLRERKGWLPLAKTRAAVPIADVNVEAAFAACGSSSEELRARVLACRRVARMGLDARLQRVLDDRGYDARRLCVRELGASLADVSVCDLLQIIALGRKDAIIDVFAGSLAGRLWCTAGELVDAGSGRLTAESAVYRIVAFGRGEVVVDFCPVRRPRAIRRSTQAVVLAAMRRKDECVELEKRLGGAQRVYRSTLNEPASADSSPLERALLQAFESGVCVSAVLASSAVDDLTVLRAIALLVERGCLVPAAVAPRPVDGVTLAAPIDLSRGSALLPGAVARQRLIRKAGAALAGLALVAVCAWAIRGSSRSRRATEVRPPAASAASQISEALRPSAHGAQGADARSPRTSPLPVTSMLDPEYPVRLVVEPAGAELWLDGRWLATGEVSTFLRRDGRPHELRISAPDRESQTILFRDVSPPRAVVLAPGDRCVVSYR